MREGAGAAASRPVRIYLAVALRGADPTALTARYALEHHLGYGDRLRRLDRSWLWRLELAVGDPEAALERAGDWVGRSQLFVNPNQHTYRLLLAGGAAAPRAGGAAAPRAGGAGESQLPRPPRVTVAVRDEPDVRGESATRVVRDRLGGGELRMARHAVVWELELEPSLAAADAAALAEEIAVSRERGRGLLMNPHFQSLCVVADASPVAVGERLWASAGG